MFTSFFKDNILPLISDEDKIFSDYSNDLTVLSFMINKDREENMFPQLKEDYISILGEELFNYKLSDEERECIVNSLKQHIEQKTKYDLHCASILDCYPDCEIRVFLFEQLKKNISGEVCLAVALLRACSCYGDLENEGEEFISFLKKQLDNDLLENKFKEYIQEVIDFNEGKINNLGNRSVFANHEGKNRKVYW